MNTPENETDESRYERMTKRLLRSIQRHHLLSTMDNKELLWHAIQSKPWTDTPLMTDEEAILSEIENRLYPEFDGEKVIATDWGWQTPEGEIRYIKEQK